MTHASKVLSGLVYGALAGTAIGALSIAFGREKQQQRNDDRGKNKKRKRDSVGHSTPLARDHSVLGPVLGKLRPFRLFVEDEHALLVQHLDRLLRHEQEPITASNVHKAMARLENSVHEVRKTLSFFRIKLAQNTQNSQEHMRAFDEASQPILDFCTNVYQNGILDGRFSRP